MNREPLISPYEDAQTATAESEERTRLRLFRRRDVTEDSRKELALQIASRYGRNGKTALAGPVEKEEVREYKGASVTVQNYNWRGTLRSADAEMTHSEPLLKSRARDQEQNNPYAERYLAELEANVLGPEGMNLQMQIETKDKNGESIPDTDKNSAIEDPWFAFKEQGICDVTGELSFHEIERVLLRSCARDGHILVRMVRYWKANKFGFALQILESDCLDLAYNVALPNGNIVINGVEMDAWRRRVAYHILTRHPGDYFATSTNKDRRERVDARDIIHLRFIRRTGQTIGVSWFAPILDMLEMLRGYEEAELTSARSEACNGGFLYSDIVPEGGFPGVPPNPLDHTRVQIKRPGQIEPLAYGVKYQPFNPSHPNGNYGGYRQGVLRGIASGMCVSYNILANDLTGVSYSSLRGGLLDEREIYKMLQSWFISRFEMIVFRAWLESSIIHGAVNLPVYDFDKYRPYFQGRRWDWVDPVKDIEAIERAIEAKLTSRRDEIAKRGGYIVDVLKAQKADLELESRIFRTEPAPAGAPSNSTLGTPAPTPNDASAGTAVTPSGAAESGVIQSTALNGAQVDALVAVIGSIAAGQIPKETGSVLISAAFPLIKPETVTAMLAPITPKVPETPPAPASPAAPSTPAVPEPAAA